LEGASQAQHDSDPVGQWEPLAAGIQQLNLDSQVDGLFSGGWFDWSWLGDKVDYLDRLTAVLSIAAARKPRNLLVTFPDGCNHRPATLFSSLLLDQWFSAIQTSGAGRQVLYFGQSAGIRRQLSDIIVRFTKHGPWLQLSRLFTQVTVDRDVRQETLLVYSNWEAYLPLVVYSYGLADPEAIVHERRPSLIAVDCTTDRRFDWIPQVLTRAREAGIPTIVWTSNPLSHVNQFFHGSEDLRLFWPRISAHSAVPLHDEIRGSSLQGCFRDRLTRGSIVSPISLSDGSSRTFSIDFLDCARHLIKVDASPNQRLLHDTTTLVWRYLRELEGVCVPLPYFDREAQNYWGLTPFESLQSGVEHFMEALDPTMELPHDELQKAVDDAKRAQAHLSQSDPPLWRALVGAIGGQIKKGGPPVTYVFARSARRQIFESALLQMKGIGRAELEKNDIRIADVSSLGISAQTHARGAGTTNTASAEPTNLVFVDLSVLRRASYIPDVFTNSSIGVFVFLHQIPFLQGRVGQLNDGLSFNLAPLRDVLTALLPEWPPPTHLPSATSSFVSAGPKVNAEMIPESTKLPELPLARVMREIDRMSEISFLMGVDDEEEPTALIREDSRSGVAEIHEGPETPWLDEALEVRFNDDWRAQFDPRDTIYIMSSEDGLPRPKLAVVSTLSVGDTVLFIRGQERQSLYELLLSRLHGHKDLETHIQLVKRWPKEFAEAFQVLKREQHVNLDMILDALREEGSQRTSILTLSGWMNGRVLCPIDPRDLERLATVLEMPFVEQNWETIHRAAERLRTLHRSLSIRLGHWLMDYASGLATFSVDRDQPIDATLGLSLADFRESLQILTVRNLFYVKGPFLRSSLGKLEKAD
jgi:hypothetical protein